MTAAMHEIMSGTATAAQIGAFLMGLRCKGETPVELTAAARVMRALATPVKVDRTHLIDTCGTGGDGAGIFNVSTACALVAAAAGARVAKHGNRSVSSHCGSADVLEAAGVNLDLDPAAVCRCIDQLGIGFLFAPHHHQATRFAVGPRRELGVRTVFNLLGPMTNPAGARRQVMGVFAAHWLQPLANALGTLGAEHVMVVHAEDGLDEISIAADTHFVEYRRGECTEGVIRPSGFGIEVQSLDALRVEDAGQSLAKIQRALTGKAGPEQDIVALNSAAALYVSGVVDDLEAGYRRAREVLASGTAWVRLQQLAQLSQQLANHE